VSVERVEEALKAIEYPNVASVQIIFNPFRQRPAGRVLRAGAQGGRRRDRARAAGVGLLSGKYTRETPSAPTTTARSTARRAVRRRRDVRRRAVRGRARRGRGAAAGGARGGLDGQFALRWILMHDAVSTVIPGARNPEQAQANAAAADLAPLDAS
jgi:aryl-alcohol dehydrogenase-like predicted oxidoreductase